MLRLRLSPPGDAAAIGHSTAKAGLISSTTAQVGTPGPHGSSFLVYGRGYSKGTVVSPPSWEFFRGMIAVVGLKHYTTVLANGAAAGPSTLTGAARFITVAAGTSAGASAITGAAIRKVFPTGTTAGSSTAGGVAHVLMVASGAPAGSSTFTGAATRIVLPTGTIAGVGGITGAAHLRASGAGTTAGTCGITAAAVRKVLPTGALAGTSTISGAAIRVVLPTGRLTGAGVITGQGKRIVWTTGTLTGAASVVIGIPTTRIFAPAWGNSSLTGDTQVSYVGQATAWSPAIVTGLGGYVLVESAETLSGTSAAFSIEGATLKGAAAECDGTSDLVGDGDAILGGSNEADGSGDAQADTCVVFVADGVVLAGDGFDLDGNPQPSTTSAFAGAITHAEASAPGSSRVEGSAPTPVAATGTLAGASAILFLEGVIYDAEGLEGISTTEASAGLDMRAQALSVNLSYPVATANYDPVLMAGTFLGGSIARGLATVAWNERPPS